RFPALILLPRPPRSALFPYTTSSDLEREQHERTGEREQNRPDHGVDDAEDERDEDEVEPAAVVLDAGHDGHRGAEGDSGDEQSRSEEHTSELQSRENLVCRLLLEKKK